MPQIVYVNGRYVPRCQAQVFAEDRGYQFSDGAYQVIALLGDVFIDEDPHLEALNFSLKHLDIPPPVSQKTLKIILRTLKNLNRLHNAHVYIQVTRGVQRRCHVYAEGLHPSLMVVLTPYPMGEPKDTVPEVKVITGPDHRWLRRDIKSLALLPNILARKQASRQDAYDLWQTHEGIITEGASSNAWIVTPQGYLKTHPDNGNILNGITRQTLIKLARANDIPVYEEPFTVEEAQSSPEAFITGSYSLIRAVVAMDNHPIGTGTTGPVTQKLFTVYKAHLGSHITQERKPLRDFSHIPFMERIRL